MDLVGACIRASVRKGTLLKCGVPVAEMFSYFLIFSKGIALVI